MNLYYGSNKQIDKPKIIISIRKFDFGDCFYLTSNYKQAEKIDYMSNQKKK